MHATLWGRGAFIGVVGTAHATRCDKEANIIFTQRSNKYMRKNSGVHRNSTTYRGVPQNMSLVVQQNMTRSEHGWFEQHGFT